MVGIQGLGGVPEPKSDRTDKVRGEHPNTANAAQGTSAGVEATDEVLISNEAQAAIEVQRIIQLASEETEIRVEKVEAARERIERGDFKDPEVVAEVAQRLLRFLS